MNQPDPPAAMRERFEKWARDKGYDVERWIPDERVYVREHIQCMWNAWQASLPSSEKIEEVARIFTAEDTKVYVKGKGWLDCNEVAAILREELGSGTE